MNTQWMKKRSRSTKSPANKIIGMIIAAMLLLTVPQALASTAENTEIANTVTVTWNDVSGLNSYSDTYTAIVTVALVPSPPNIVYAIDVDSTELTDVDLAYTITGTANGDDDYTIALSNPANTNLNGLTLPAANTTIVLGGTTLVANTDGVSAVLTVPFDGDDADNAINSIAENDWVVVGGTAYQVAVGGIDESTGTTTNTATITLTAVPPANAGTAGSVVGEQQTVTITVTTSDFTDTTSATGTHDVDATVSWTGGNLPQATDTVITVHRPLLTIGKYVQIVAGGSAVVGSGDTYGPIDTGSGSLTYYQEIDAPPNVTLEYIIVIENNGTGASGQANNLLMVDPVPQFTTYVLGSMRLDPDFTIATPAFGSLTDIGTDADAGESDGTTVEIYAGTGGDASAGTGGTLAAGATTIGVFQVTID